jgi:hypothetical protein
MSKTLVPLLLLAVVVGVLGVATWYLLANDNAIGSWLLAGSLFAHGWVHLMFVFPRPQPAAAAATGPPYPFDFGRSWLIGGLRLDGGLVRTIGLAVMAWTFVTLALAALATVGILMPASWWAGLVVAGALGSALLLALFASPSFLLGLGIDLALLWLVLASGWSPATGG